MKILIIEDDPKISKLVEGSLLAQEMECTLAHDGDKGLALALQNPFDAIVLDLMLPGLDGIEILRQLRDKQVMTPTIILTAKVDVSERVEGLNAGADDYLVKPFSVEELIARIRALSRRASGERTTLYKVADLSINLVSREVLRGTRKVELTTREFRLLEHLMRVEGKVLTRAELIQRVWEYHFDPGTNLVDVYIQRLRRKVDDGEAARLIHTVRGVGYCISIAPESEN
jgi:DNA-binding response OmpR family regulator